MNIVVLVIVAYLTNGNPVPVTFFLDGSKLTCGNDLALRYTRQFIVPSLPPEARLQSPEDTMVYMCVPVPPGTPGPAMRPALYPGQTEAAQLR